MSETLNYTLFQPKVADHEIEAVVAVLRRNWLAMGPEVAAFEAELAEFLGVGHAVALSSCTAALHIAYMLAGVGPEDEVIVPSLTFAATANAVTYSGGKPVFADVASVEDFTLDPEDVARKITKRTRAVVPMHYAGRPSDMEALSAICRDAGLAVIEDACHGLGGSVDGKALGTLGQTGCFSFYSNKIMTTGEGGALVTDDMDLADRARRLRTHGQTKTAYDRIQGALGYDITEVGFNYRMDDIRGALGRVQLRRVAASVERRGPLVDRYRRNIGSLEKVTLPEHGKRGTPAHYILPVLLDASIDREILRARLADAGVQTSVHYPAVHRFAHYADNSSSLPVTEDVAARTLTLPLYPDMSDADVDLICERLDRVIRSL